MSAHASTLQVLAWAPRADVLTNTGNGDVPHDANGVGWYYSIDWSWGFAPQGVVINRNSCDLKASSFDSTGGAAAERVCWHTRSGTVGPGWRCGANDELDSTTHERVIYHAD